MRPTTIIGASLLSVLLFASAGGAGEIIEGVVTVVNSASLQIDAQTYVVTDRTVCKDKGGRQVALHEVHAGMPVEAEIEDDRKLGVVTVDLLR